MTTKYLKRWQANALCEALWSTHQPKARNWQKLTPNLPQTTPSQQTVVEDAYTGRHHLRSTSRVQGPLYLPVRVPELRFAGVLEHDLVITHTDYNLLIHALAVQEPNQFRAWVNYIHKPRLSSIFWLTSSSNGVERSRHVTKDLSAVALELLEVAEYPLMEELEARALEAA